MINSKQKWLLTASPWAKNNFRLLPSAPVAIGGLILTALLIFSNQIGNAQIRTNAKVNDATTTTATYSGTSTGAAMLPAITGANSVCIGGTTNLSNATAGGVWSTGNASIATVSSGVVTGVAQGTTNITYTVGSFYTYYGITVVGVISGASSVCVSNYATYVDATAAGNWSVTANTGAATITPTGVLYGTTAGTVTVSYTRPGCTVTQVVTVNANPVAQISGALAVCVGSTTVMTDATASGTWSSSNAALASIDGSTGTVTGNAIGTPVISYSQGGCYRTKTITVNSTYPAAIGGTAAVCTGNNTTLTEATTSGTWSSANTFATVNTHGVVTGAAAGSAIISYTKTGCAAVVTVNVSANTVASITGTLLACVSGTTQLADATGAGTWSSSNTSYATVDGTGLVTGAGVGTATITYTVGGACYQSAAVVVNTNTIASITGTAAVCVGSTTVLADATLGGAWSTSNSAVATVSVWGTVTGVSAGSATIYYTKSGCNVSQVVTVTGLPTAITGTLTVCGGSVRALGNATPGGTWSSSNTAIATVDGTGNVTGVANGTTTIAYTVGGCAATAVMTVNAPAAIMGGNTLCMAPFTYLYLYESSTAGAGQWSSSNSNIASVSSTTAYTASTAITPKLAGTVTISYNLSGCYATKSITVNWAPGLISGNNVACIGTGTLLTDTMAGGTWATSNSAIATVSGGTVTGVTAGTVNISYSNAAGCYQVKSMVVNASPAAITGSSSVCAGSGAVYPTITLSDATTGGTWSTSTSNLAVSGGGVVKGLLAGSGVITYTVNDCSATKTVTVSANGAGTLSFTAVTGAYNVCTGTPSTIASTTSGGVWSTSNITVATVSTVTTTTGIINGVTEGSVYVTYTIPSTGCFKIFGSMIDVHNGAGTLSGGYSICGYDSLTLTSTQAGGTWTVSDGDVASITALTTSTAKVKAITAPGTLTITYTMPGGCQAYQPFSINNTPGSIYGYNYGISTNYLAFGTSGCTPLPNGQVFNDAAGGTWTSSNTALATIDPSTGVVTGVAAGTPNITYTIGTCWTKQTITVNGTAPTVSTTTPSICAGDTTHVVGAPIGTVSTYNKWFMQNPYTATVAYVVSATNGVGTIYGLSAGTQAITYVANGCMQEVIITVNANTVPAITGNNFLCASGSTTTTQLSNVGTGNPYTWSSLTAANVTVNSATGLVTVGTNTVTPNYTYIRYKDNTTGCYQLYMVTVNNTLPAAITGTLSACAGYAGVTLADATASGTWTTDNSTVATVSVTGLVSPLSAGVANINYVVNGCGVSAPAAFTVNASPAAITAGSYYVCVGNTLALSDATPAGSWTSGTPAKATVDGSGVVTGVAGNGRSIISYTVAGCAATYAVTVGVPTDAILKWNNQVKNTMCVGDTVLMKDTTDANGRWTSSNAGVVALTTFPSAGLGLPYGTSTNGAIEALAAGTATITFTTPGCAAATLDITVNYTAPITGVNSVCTLNVTALSDETVGGTWTTSNSALATVDASGNVTGVAAGTPNITYTASGCYAYMPVLVSNCGRIGSNGSVEDGNGAQSYVLSPNPTSGNIIITQGIATSDAVSVKVINSIGATVYTGSLSFTNRRSELNLANVNTGMYLVQLTDSKGETQSFKMVVEK